MANCRYCGTDCPEQGEHDRFFDCELYTDRIPTNADRIRGMSDEELAEWLTHLPKICTCHDHCELCIAQKECDKGCEGCIKDWLQQAAETEGTE